MYHRTTYYYKLAIQKVLDNANNMDKQDILNELNIMLNDKADDSPETYRN
jgi:hypothetical protein